ASRFVGRRDRLRAERKMGKRRRGVVVSLLDTAMKLIRFGLLIGAIVTTAASCATSGAVPPPGSPTTLMYGWEHHFSIDWTAVEQTGNTRRVSGYVQNHNGEFATHLRVLRRQSTLPAPSWASASPTCPEAWADSGGPTSSCRACPSPTAIGSASGTTPGTRRPEAPYRDCARRPAHTAKKLNLTRS